MFTEGTCIHGLEGHLNAAGTRPLNTFDLVDNNSIYEMCHKWELSEQDQQWYISKKIGGVSVNRLNLNK